MPPSAPSLNALSSEIAALAAQTEQSVVGIESARRRTSGFFWNANVIVTASDALEAGKDDAVKVRFATGDVAEARVLGHDPTTDVALVGPERNGQAISSDMPVAPHLGSAVLALGRSAYGATCATGFVSLAGPAWRSVRGGEIARRLWLDLRLAAHAEGGPVIDTSGSLVGMAAFGPRRRTLVIPVETIERVAAEIQSHGRVRRGYLGVGVQSVRVMGSDGALGLMVVSVDDKGPARQAGVLQGDILLSIGGSPLRSARSLARLLPGTLIGSSARVDLVRAGESKSLEITVGESPGT